MWCFVDHEQIHSIRLMLTQSFVGITLLVDLWPTASWKCLPQSNTPVAIDTPRGTMTEVCQMVHRVTLSWSQLHVSYSLDSPFWPTWWLWWCWCFVQQEIWQNVTHETWAGRARMVPATPGEPLQARVAAAQVALGSAAQVALCLQQLVARLWAPSPAASAWCGDGQTVLMLLIQFL